MWTPLMWCRQRWQSKESKTKRFSADRLYSMALYETPNHASDKMVTLVMQTPDTKVYYLALDDFAAGWQEVVG